MPVWPMDVLIAWLATGVFLTAFFVEIGYDCDEVPPLWARGIGCAIAIAITPALLIAQILQGGRDGY